MARERLLILRRVRRLLLLVLLLAVAAPAQLHAQDDGGDEAAPGGPTYVVEAGDSLYSVAVAFGVTIDALRLANGMSEEDPLLVGQVLVVPVPGYEQFAGELATRAVQIGDSLDSLSYILGEDRDTLVQLNRIVNPTQLYVGQQMIHFSENVGLTSGRLVLAGRGETLLQLAIRYGVTPVQLTLQSNLVHPAALYGGAKLVTPEPDTPLTGLAAPLLAMRLKPENPRHGHPLGIQVDVLPGVTLAGRFHTWDLTFHALNDGTQVALQGIHAFTDPGLYPLEITATAPDGRAASFSQLIPVGDAGYEYQQIVLTGETADLLDATIVEPEAALIGEMATPVTAQRYWDGAWLEPVPMQDRVTAPFGIRRSYNEGPFNSFHSGTDLGGPSTTPVLAPAGGVVVMAQPLQVRGNAIMIDHGWGVYTGYWHLSQMLVETGQQVEAGQQIGFIGSTGLSTGNHLHFELWVAGIQVDPPTWIALNDP